MISIYQTNCLASKYGYLYVQLDVVIARNFIAWEIALGKLANSINYAAFLEQNKQPTQLHGSADLQEGRTKHDEQVEAGQGTVHFLLL